MSDTSPTHVKEGVGTSQAALAQRSLALQALVDSTTCLMSLDENGIVREARNAGFAAARFALLSDHKPMELSDAQCLGLPLDQVWPSAMMPIVDMVSQRALSTDADASLEHTLSDANRNPVHLRLRARVSQEKSPDNDEERLFHLTVTDTTSQKLQINELENYATNLTAANARLRLALQGSKVTIFEQDLDLRYTFMANTPELMGGPPIGKTDPQLFGETGKDLENLKRNLVLDGSSWAGRIDIPSDGGEVSFDVELEPRFSNHGEVIGLTGTAIDLSDLKQHEDAMRLAMREITHRTKNLLAVIQATARRTASKAPSKEAFVDSFSKRLSAMSQSHDLLVRSNWAGADLEELVKRNARQAGGEREGAFAISGPSLTLTSETAQHFGMALHELVSNALKYGSLSVDGGVVRVSWDFVDQDDAQGELEAPSTEPKSVLFTWIEQGGPDVSPPQSAGFGTSYLQRAVAMAMNAQTDLDFAADGLRCSIKMPGDCFH